MNYEDAKSSCHVRSAIVRKAHPDRKFWKNHSVPLDERVPENWKLKTDWQEHDPRDELPASYHALES